jgi:hypothetical protein
MAYVYRHIRLDKNEPFYIGIGNQSNHKRAYDYSKNRRNKIWLDIVAKTEYEIEIIFDELSWEEACEKEKEFIALYGRKDLKTGTLANLTIGGDGVVGALFTDEHKRKIGEKSNGRRYSKETRSKMGNAQLGNKKYLLRTTPQEEINKKISLANKGRIRSEEHKEKIRNYFKIYGHPCFGKNLTDETKQKMRDKKQKRPVVQKDANGNIIKIWESTKSVIPFGFLQSSVWKCCRNLSKHHRGYIWEYYKQ